MDTFVVLCAVFIFVMVYISLYRAVGPAQRDLRRRADENAQELLERHRSQDYESLDRDEEYQ